MNGDATVTSTSTEIIRLLTAAGWEIEHREAETTESQYLVCVRGERHITIRVSCHCKPGFVRYRRTRDTWETGPRFPASIRRWLTSVL